MDKAEMKKGFTLVELAIVLVVIGLIVGGILVGRDMIESASLRSTITQIESYNLSVATFQVKYRRYIPGDIPASKASMFGLQARNGERGQGDGNGILEGWTGSAMAYGWNQRGETLLFWKDLSDTGMIKEKFTLTTGSDGANVNTYSGIAQYIPTTKLSSTFIFVYTIHWAGASQYSANTNNFFGLSDVSALASSGGIDGGAGLTANQAYNVDAKTDDGNPQSGKVLAYLVDRCGSSNPGWACYSTVSSSTTCFETTNQTYSTGINGGNNPTCGLRIRTSF